MTKTILLIIGVTLLLGVGFVIYKNSLITNEELKFKFSNSWGWKHVEPNSMSGWPPEGHYYLIYTDKNNSILSSVGVQTVNNNGQKPLDKQFIENICRENATKAQNNPNSNYTLNEATINNTSGFKCSYSGKGTQTDKNLVIDQYFLFPINSTPNDYIITVSTPQADSKSASKAHEFVQSFSAL